MTYHCHRCATDVSFVERGTVGFRDECSSCKNDLHVCKNCKFYKAGAYNECTEPNAERVTEKERANRCEYFKFREGKTGSEAVQNTAKKAISALDDLFKK